MSNRRDFIKNAVAGSIVAGTAVASPAIITRAAFAEAAKKKYEIKYRTLGSTGYKVSEIGFGAMNTRDPELIHAAIDSGINYLDTAHGYMNGVNEEIIGGIMKTKRDKVFLVTKIRARNVEDVPSMIETSLKRLQTDHVDLLLVHVTSKREQILEPNLMKKFEEARKKGQTRFIGVSTHSNQAEVLDAAVESKLWEAVLVGYNYLSPKAITDSIGKARKAGLAIIGMKNILNPNTNPWKEIDDFRKDKKSTMTAQQALIRWALDNPDLDTTIPGMTSFEHLADDLALMTMKLSYEDRSMLRRYAENIKGKYCLGVAGCNGCKDQCPYGVAVNDINRCLGYANGYGDIELAKENYKSLEKNLSICSNCDECVVKCVNGNKISEKIEMAKTLFV